MNASENPAAGDHAPQPLKARVVLNPVTNRYITVGGSRYKQLLREGAFGGAKTAAEVCRDPPPADSPLHDMPPPAPGMFWRRNQRGEFIQVPLGPRTTSEDRALRDAARGALALQGIPYDDAIVEAFAAKIKAANMGGVTLVAPTVLTPDDPRPRPPPRRVAPTAKANKFRPAAIYVPTNRRLPESSTDDFTTELSSDDETEHSDYPAQERSEPPPRRASNERPTVRGRFRVSA